MMLKEEKRVALFLFFLVLCSSFVLGKVIITEIMYDPVGSDSGHEWIEIYSNEAINISGWRFYEGGINHQLSLVSGNFLLEGYAVIADEADTFLEDYPNFNGTLFDSSWSALSNTGEFLGLRNSSLDMIHEINYSSDWGGQNGFSLELRDVTQSSSNASYWNTSLIQNGTPGRVNSITPCVSVLINTSWSDWINQSGCLLNDTYLQNRSLIQYDVNACTANITITEQQYLSCDYCVPQWIAVNTSCFVNDSVIQWYNDTNRCYSLTNLTTDLITRPANETFELSCDFDNDGFIGTIADANSSLENLSVKKENNTVIFFQGKLILAEFESFETINLAEVFIDKQKINSEEGYILVRGLQQNKSLYVDRLSDDNILCLKDMEIAAISEISDGCSGENETLLTCDGITNNYTCTLVDNQTRYKVSGLQHSAVIEQKIDTNPELVSSSSGGGGGSRRSSAVVIVQQENETVVEVSEEISESHVKEVEVTLSLENGTAIFSGWDENWWSKPKRSNLITGNVVGEVQENEFSWYYGVGISGLVIVLCWFVYWKRR